MIRNLFILFLTLLGTVTAFYYYTQYFQWRDCFNDQGRCFDPEMGIVYLEQAGIVWGLQTIFFWGAAMFIMRHKFKK